MKRSNFLTSLTLAFGLALTACGGVESDSSQEPTVETQEGAAAASSVRGGGGGSGGGVLQISCWCATGPTTGCPYEASGTSCSGKCSCDLKSGALEDPK